MAADPAGDDGSALARLNALLVAAMVVKRPWVVLMVAAAALSAVHIDINADGDVSGSFGVTSLTALLLALIWLPSLLRIVGISGGGIKTPAGEATTGGLAQVLDALDPQTKREALPPVLAALQSPEIVSDAKRSRAVRPLRRDLQLQLAAVTPDSGSGPEALDHYASEYEAIREQPPGSDRTARMTSVVEGARAIAPTLALTSDDISEMLGHGTDGQRVIALAIAADQPDLTLFDSIVDAIAESRSAFEQYQALGAVYGVLPRLDAQQREKLTRTLRSAVEDPVRGIKADASRRMLAEGLLSDLEARS